MEAYEDGLRRKPVARLWRPQPVAGHRHGQCRGLSRRLHRRARLQGQVGQVARGRRGQPADVARGDLGVEVPLEEVPLVQKRAIQIARENAKPVIVATQMLDSMISNLRPIRAEASDVANAVLDGADAVMLSGETSVGIDPQNVVRTMSKIVANAEDGGKVPPLSHVPRTKRGVVSYSARDIAERLNAKAIVAFTTSGDTAKRVARLHSHLPLLAFTPDPAVRSELALTWGAETFLSPHVKSTDDMMEAIDDALLEMDKYEEGDMIVVIAGTPPGIAGNTNMIQCHLLGETKK